MARRRITSSVDTSDPMANLVLGSLLIGLVALLGLVFVLSSDDDEPDAQQASGAQATPTGLATVEPAPTAGAAPTTAPPPAEEAQEPAPTAGPGAADDAPAPAAPLQPREDRTDAPPGTAPEEGVEEAAPGADERPAPAPDTSGDDLDDPAAGDDLDEPGTHADAPATGDADVPPADDGAGPDDEPVVPPSPIDDADREPALVISDEPANVHTVLANFERDDQPERVRAAIVRNAVEVEVQRPRSGGGWVTVDRASGAVADHLVGLWVQDLTGDGRPEVHTRQWVGAYGESVSLWSFDDDDELRPMTASGGCWDGTHTFGVVGALVHPGEVMAICEEPPLVTSLWSTAVYEWEDGRWTFQRRIGVYQPA
ncbi:MAG TPA: hypothetical protein VK891_08610 [Euzebyales bacterium]|nr:hypothetical protein [Euzebyales bacterium]